MKNIDGTWKVKVESGPLWFRGLNLLDDKKIIKNGKGYNKVWTGRTWGKFKVFKLGSLYVLKYTELPIVDNVWFDGENELKGRFNLKGEFVGEFRMIRGEKP